MSTRTIKIGIDLGTTNSAIAASVNGDVQIIKNIHGDETTPSVVWVDANGKALVGRKAFDKLFKESSSEAVQNTKAEVKRLMGTAEQVRFGRSGKSLTAEEVSAQILSSLRMDLQRKFPDFPTYSAVIAIPAYFSTVQAEATHRAGVLAGFEYVVLIQEPIAAAMAYGFGGSANENWLVYDLGGGTFDVALISSRDGVLSVLGHHGDNFLGGKDFDNAIIDSVLAPVVRKKCGLADFTRANPDYFRAFVKLKYLAESAKIELSQSDHAEIELSTLPGPGGEIVVDLVSSLTRSELRKIVAPYLERTVMLALATLSDAKVDKGSVKRVIIVGGPTQLPFVREILEERLGVPVDASVDPHTVVARGACVFGSSQIVPDIGAKGLASAQTGFELKLNYEALSAETEQTITGLVKGLPDGEHALSIQSDSGSYTSPKLRLKDGKFFTTVPIEPKRTNLYWVYLFDAKGVELPLASDSFEIVHGLSVSGAPIPHSIGVAVIERSGNQIETFDVFFERNSLLPLKATKKYFTSRALARGSQENALPVKICEGESSNPDRNSLVCELKISGEKLAFDLPERTPVELTIEVNQSRELRVTAYLPTIDLTMNARASVYAETVEVDHLQSSLSEQVSRLDSVAIEATDKPADISSLIASINAGIKTAKIDDDEKRRANKLLQDLKIAIDRLESETSLARLQKLFSKTAFETHQVISDFEPSKKRPEYLAEFNAIKQEGERADETKNGSLLAAACGQLSQLRRRVLLNDHRVLTAYLMEVEKEQSKFRDSARAAKLLADGREAAGSGLTDDLRRIVLELIDLTLVDDQKSLPVSIAGITR